MVVEDWSCWESNAVILKGTTVLTYKPHLLDRPFSGSLAGIEVRGLVAMATAAQELQEELYLELELTSGPSQLIMVCICFN